jgi:hypothetical protein
MGLASGKGGGDYGIVPYAQLSPPEGAAPLRRQDVRAVLAATLLHIAVLCLSMFLAPHSHMHTTSGPAIVAVKLLPPASTPPLTALPGPKDSDQTEPKPVKMKPVKTSPEAPPDERHAQADSVTTPPVDPPSYLPPPILDSQSGSTAGGFASNNQLEDENRDYVPSRWALEPPLAAKRLEGLGLLGQADCLRSLSPDCQDIRAEVFEDYALTETQRVWTPRRADTGMPSQFFGLSEREIRLKIGSKIAGENGFMLLPGIGLDGELWDRLHGVKRGCQMKRGVTPDGNYGVVRVCPESLPAARERKIYIPPKREP